jgi:hypothetical protein
MNFIDSNGPLRKGCMVKWIDKSTSQEFQGTIVNHSYGKKTNQHTFTIDCGATNKLVKGRNLYDRLISHTPGEISRLN